MKRAVIVASKKGGAGKSFVSSGFAEGARAAGRTVSLWDLDGQTGTLALRYGIGDPLTAAAVEDIRDPASGAKWLDAMDSDADDVVLDVPGGALGDLLRTFDAGATALVDEIKKTGREVVLVSVLTHKKDGTATAQESVELFGSSVRHVVVKNEFFADAGHFIVYDGYIHPETNERRYGNTADMVRAVGGEVVALPKLNSIADELCEVEELTFSQAADSASKIGRRASGNVRFWLSSVEKAFQGTWLDVRGEVSSTSARPKSGVRVAVG